MLTITIPSFNQEQYIVDCISAARKINIPGKQIIVIDDGSSDSTVEKIRNLKEETSDSSITLICKPNSGLVSSLNLGLSLSTNKYFYCVASDDIPVPDGILRCVEELEGNNSFQFCIGGGFCFSGENNLFPIYGKDHLLFFEKLQSNLLKTLFLDYPTPLLLQSTVFRKESLISIGGWTKCLVLDDQPTFIKLFNSFPAINKDFIFRPQYKTVKYRLHANNSYKDIFRQYSLVKQMVIELAPTALRERALGKNISKYFLSGISNGDINGIVNILSDSSKVSKLHALPYLMNIFFSKAIKAVEAFVTK